MCQGFVDLWDNDSDVVFPSVSILNGQPSLQKESLMKNRLVFNNSDSVKIHLMFVFVDTGNLRVMAEQSKRAVAIPPTTGHPDSCFSKVSGFYILKVELQLGPRERSLH